MQIFTPFAVKGKGRFVRTLALLLPVVCLVVLLAQTALAQNTFVITDGDQVTVHTSFASDPKTVLDEAGVELDGNDFYTTAAGDGVSEITVQREQTVHVDYCGEVLELGSYGETVGQLLSRNGIKTYGSFSISEDMSALTYDGMQLHIDNVVQAEESYTVEDPYEVVYCNDPTLPVGQEKVLVQGVAGQVLRVAQVVYRNGQEQSRIILEESVLQQPVDEIVAVGTGTKVGEKRTEPLIGDGVIVLPTGEVLTYSSADTYKATAYTSYDAGCDRITATGTYVHAGTVAVDPKVIPYGTRMFIVTNDGRYIYGVSTAEDCGGGVKGKHVDLYFETKAEAYAFGVRSCTIYFLGEEEA